MAALSNNNECDVDDAAVIRDIVSRGLNRVTGRREDEWNRIHIPSKQITVTGMTGVFH